MIKLNKMNYINKFLAPIYTNTWSWFRYLNHYSFKSIRYGYPAFQSVCTDNSPYPVITDYTLEIEVDFSDDNFIDYVIDIIMDNRYEIYADKIRHIIENYQYRYNLKDIKEIYLINNFMETIIHISNKYGKDNEYYLSTKLHSESKFEVHKRLIINKKCKIEKNMIYKVTTHIKDYDEGPKLTYTDNTCEINVDMRDFDFKDQLKDQLNLNDNIKHCNKIIDILRFYEKFYYDYKGNFRQIFFTNQNSEVVIVINCLGNEDREFHLRTRIDN